jgi:hypothetical protein
MKNNLLFLMLCLTTLTTVLAQKITYKKDTLKVDDVPYCVITSKDLFNPTYTVKSLGGKDIAIAKTQQAGSTTTPVGYFLVTFLGSGNQCEMSTTFGFGKKLGTAMFEAKVFENGEYTEEGERKFLLLNDNKISQRANANAQQNNNGISININDNTGRNTNTGRNNNNNNNNNNSNRNRNRPQTVSRNRDSDVSVWAASKEIKQDFKLIGKYTETREGVGIVFRFSLPDGTDVAKITMKSSFDKSCKVLVVGNIDAYDLDLSSQMTSEMVKEMALHLIGLDLL